MNSSKETADFSVNKTCARDSFVVTHSHTYIYHPRCGCSMPALLLFHRRTIFGGDDLQPTSILTIVVRVVQISLLCIPILHYTISHLIQIIQQQQQQQYYYSVPDNEKFNDNYDHSSWLQLLVDRLLFQITMSSSTTSTSTAFADGVPSWNEMNESVSHFTDGRRMMSRCRSATNMSDEMMEQYINDDNDAVVTSINSHTNNDITSWKLFYIVVSIWCGGTILYNIGSILLERYIIYWCSYGTPTQNIQIRSYHIQQLLYIKLIPLTILLFLLSFTALFGIVVYYIIPQHYKMDPKNHLNSTHTNSPCDLYYTNVGTSFQHTDEPIRTSLWWVAVIILLLAQLIEVFVSMLFTYQLYQLPPIRESGSDGVSSSAAAAVAAMFPVASERMIMNNSVSAADDNDTNANATTQMNYNHELVEEMWANRCAATCHCLSVSTCYMFGGRNLVDVVSTSGRSATNGGTTATSTSHSIFVDVARALADFLESRGVLDVVPSDIVTGLILLQRIQRQRIYTARQQYKTNTNGMLHTNPYQDDATSANMTIDRVESGILDNTVLMNGNATTNIMVQHETTRTIRKRSSSKNLHSIQPNDNGGLLGRRRSRSNSPDFLLPPEPVNATAINDSHNPCREGAPALEKQGSNGALRTQHQQNALHSYYRMNASGGGYQREERALLNRDNFTELYLLDEAARYAKYALAIYTWVLYLYEHPITGPFRLLLRNGYTLCCSDCSKRRSYEQPTLEQHYASDDTAVNASLMSFIDENGRIDGDNICQTHKNAILLTAGLKEADIVYVQLRSSLSDIPYCILLDHAWKSIVVSIRGTFSIEDCITDVLITPESLEILGKDFNFDAIDEYCHGGVMSCARNVYRDLDRHGLLDKLLLGEDAKYDGYTLRIVGHSLGAATSTLLSYMLKQKFPNLRCINYSPPGCTFTWKMATQCKEWCTSCVLDSDLVPRLTVESIERLRDEILDLIGRVKVPKAVVAQRFTENTFRLCNDDYDKDGVFNDDLADVLFDPEEVPETEYQQQLLRFKEIQTERRRHRGTTRSIQLYPPGRILHLIKTGEKRSCTAGLAKIVTCCTTNIGSTYIPVWVDNDDLNEIVVGPRMGTDHFPNRIRAILDEVATNFGL